MNTLYGPLPQKYCLYFYVMSVILFLSFLLLLGKFLWNMFKKKELSNIFHANLMITTLIGYFTNRLLYTMCVNSVK
jgi:hypothetical protein